MGSGPRRPALQALLLTTSYIASLTVSRFSLTCPSLLEWFTVLLKQSKVTRSPCFQPHHLLTHQVASPRSYAFLILQDVRFFSPTKLSLFPFTRYGFPHLNLFHLQAEGVRVICPDTLHDWRLLPRWTIMTPEQGPELPSAFASHGLLFWYNPRKFLMPWNIKTPSIYLISFFPLSKFGNNGKASHLTKAGLEWHLVAIF